MCCSFWPIRFSQTITGVWEVFVDAKLQQVMWYQNRIGDGKFESHVFEVLVQRALEGLSPRSPENQGILLVNNIDPDDVQREANKRLRAKGRVSEVVPITGENPEGRREGNALLIPILGEWDSIRLLNTHSVPNILLDIRKALKVPAPIPAAGWGGSKAFGGMPSRVIFLKFDIYDIVIARDARDLAPALEQIDPDKRPKINDEVFKTLYEWYGCPVAMCCFNNADSGESKPLAFAFEPLYPEKLVVYTLDGHDGKAPRTDEQVSVDHTIFAGSYLSPLNMCAQVKYSNAIAPDLRPYIIENVLGIDVYGLYRNGDIVFNTADVRKGKLDGFRTTPPKTPAQYAAVGERIWREEPYIQP